MSQSKKRLIGKSLKYYEDGKTKHWGKVLDYLGVDKGDCFAVYSGKNPIGYRVWYEGADDVLEWINEGKIFEL